MTLKSHYPVIFHWICLVVSQHNYAYFTDTKNFFEIFYSNNWDVIQDQNDYYNQSGTHGNIDNVDVTQINVC